MFIYKGCAAVRDDGFGNEAAVGFIDGVRNSHEINFVREQ